MGKGARKKIAGVERADGSKIDEDEERRDNEDALDDPRSRKGTSKGHGLVDEKTWKPRIYKWKMERKR